MAAELEQVTRDVIQSLTVNDNIPRNILLIGSRSSGKSSLINLLKAALVGYYEELEAVGPPDLFNKPCTCHLRCVRSMGLRARELTTFRAKHQLAANVSLPNIIDIPGLDHVDEIMFKYVLRGKVPPDTEVFSSLSQGMMMPMVDMEMDDDMAIDCVLFVASIKESIPSPFFQQVRNLICFNDTLKRLPFRLVFTHCDANVSRELIEKRQEEASNVLGISQHVKLRSHSIVNYSDTDPINKEQGWTYATDLKKHTNALLLLNKLLNLQKIVDNRDLRSEMNPNLDQLTLWSQALWRRKRLCYATLGTLVVFLMLLPTVFFLLLGIVLFLIVIFCF